MYKHTSKGGVIEGGRRSGNFRKKEFGSAPTLSGQTQLSLGLPSPTPCPTIDKFSESAHLIVARTKKVQPLRVCKLVNNK